MVSMNPEEMKPFLAYVLELPVQEEDALLLFKKARQEDPLDILEETFDHHSTAAGVASFINSSLIT